MPKCSIAGPWGTPLNSYFVYMTICYMPVVIWILFKQVFKSLCSLVTLAKVCHSAIFFVKTGATACDISLSMYRFCSLVISLIHVSLYCWCQSCHWKVVTKASATFQLAIFTIVVFFISPQLAIIVNIKVFWYSMGHLKHKITFGFFETI